MNHKHRIVSIILVIALACAGVNFPARLAAAGEQGNNRVLESLTSNESDAAIDIYLDGEYLFTVERPLIDHGYLLLPLREIASKLGVEVIWEAGSGDIILKGKTTQQEEFELTFYPGYIRVNEELPPRIKILMESYQQDDIRPILVNNCTMFPLRMLTDIIDMPVKWEEKSRSIFIGEEPERISDRYGEVQQVLCEDNNGQHIFLKKGEEVIVNLNSNPSTGYSWVVHVQPDQNIIAMSDSVFTDNNSPDGRPVMGAAGQECWRLKAIKPGKTRLVLWYMRPWESVQPLHIFEIDITIK